MSNPFTTAFDAALAVLGTPAQATLTRSGDDPFTVMYAAGTEGLTAVDESGRLIEKTATARFKLADDLSTPLAEGDLVTIAAGDAPALDLRVIGRMDTAGLVRLSLVAEEH
jgi:hypothetical protein